VKRRRGHSTMPLERPPMRRSTLPPPAGVKPPPPRPVRQVARIIDESDSSLLDVLDNLLNRGVVLNAELILALADVDLVYVRLSALLCAADRVLPDETSE
jgi:Gas vesicle protein